MKLLLILNLFAFCAVDCFLTNPFLADNSVKNFLDIIDSNNDGNNFMNYAVDGELCNRKCKTNDKKICRFKFMIKFYQAMSGWVNFQVQTLIIESFQLSELVVTAFWGMPQIACVQNVWLLTEFNVEFWQSIFNFPVLRFKFAKMIS